MIKGGIKKYTLIMLSLFFVLTFFGACKAQGNNDETTHEAKKTEQISDKEALSSDTLTTDDKETQTSETEDSETEDSGQTAGTESEETEAVFEPFTVKIKQNKLFIFSSPAPSGKCVQVLPMGTYTIVEECLEPDGRRWGKLKSGIGWIDLDGAAEILKYEKYSPVSLVISEKELSGKIEKYTAYDYESHGGERLIFVANEGITDVRLYLLDGGEVEYEQDSLLYSLPRLKTGGQLAASVVFYGDMTAYGISFTDKDGKERHFAVTAVNLSGSGDTFGIFEYTPITLNS